MKKIAILGGGPAGYVAAIRAAQLGAEVTLVEAGSLGGTCLNVGCIPTKCLIHNAKELQKMKRAIKENLINSALPQPNFQKIMDRKSEVVRVLVQGLTQLLAAKKVKIISGNGRLEPDKTITVSRADGTKTVIKADAVIVCTGSEPSSPRSMSTDGEWSITSKEALSLKEIPRKLVIIGGGIIGVEFAYIYGQLGSTVALIEQEQCLIPQEDPDAGKVLTGSLKRAGIAVELASTVTHMDRSEKLVRYKNSRGEEVSVTADCVLIATGRKPCLVGLEKVAGSVLEMHKGAIAVSKYLETSLAGVYAAGDVTGLWQLAHAAFEQGTVAAENAVLGNHKIADLAHVPRCIYTNPEIASVGISEREAKGRYDDVVIGRFPLRANGKALADAAEEGFAKVVARRKYGQVLGVSIVGENAGDLIGQAVLALQLEATLDEMAKIIAPHPTISESLKEAALGAMGRAVHC